MRSDQVTFDVSWDNGDDPTPPLNDSQVDLRDTIAVYLLKLIGDFTFPLRQIW